MTLSRHAAPSAFLDAPDVLAGQLGEEVSMAPITEGALFAYEKTVFDGPDGFCAVWACDAGVFPRVKDRRGSFMYLLSGEGTIVDEDGTSHELAADTVLVLPYSWAGTWHIRKTIRKVYVHTTPVAPLPDHPVPSVCAVGDEVKVVFDGPDGECAVAVLEPGKRNVKDERSLFGYVIAGEATVTDDIGEAHDLRQGSVIMLPAGWAGSWEVRQTMRLFTVRSTPAADPSAEEHR
jgi:uncharacterized cupin superfamily protein